MGNDANGGKGILVRTRMYPPGFLAKWRLDLSKEGRLGKVGQSCVEHAPCTGSE